MIHRLMSSRYDNLVSGVAEISLGTSIGTLWSEYAVATTGCGPVDLSDGLERLCYQGVIASAGATVFALIVTGESLERASESVFGTLEEITLWQVRWAERLSLAAVLGAIVALTLQYAQGESIVDDGLSGIDVAMCRALREL